MTRSLVPFKRSAEHGFESLKRSAEHGFTLVEVMIALMIFGMLAAAGVALLAFSVRAQAVTGATLDDATALSRLSSSMTADLAQAMDRPTRDEAGTIRPAFVGESTGMNPVLQLTRGGWTNIDGDARASIQKVEYRLNGDVVERVAYPMIDGAPPLPATAMLNKVRQLSTRYRFAGAWTDRWDGAQGAPLPQAMELGIVRSDGTAYRELFVVGTGRRPRQTVFANAS